MVLAQGWIWQPNNKDQKQTPHVSLPDLQ
jgi:hypothetical protein